MNNSSVYKIRRQTAQAIAALERLSNSPQLSTRARAAWLKLTIAARALAGERKRRGRPCKVEYHVFRDLANRGESIASLAERFHCSEKVIRTALNRKPIE
jgi:hypothetical protein